jgi:hypothetical protein
MDKDLFFGQFERGRLLQLKDEECRILSHKMFEYYDTHVRGELGPRQQKTILADFYRIVGIKNPDIKPEEMAILVALFHNEDRKNITEEDFMGFVKRLFKSNETDGALNGQLQNKDLIDFDYQGHHRNENSGRIVEGLREHMAKRFGREFLDFQMKLLVDTYISCGLNLNLEYPYDKIKPFVLKINESSVINARTDEFEIGEKEMQRIFGLIDYDAKHFISWDEIQIFYLRGLLGM